MKDLKYYLGLKYPVELVETDSGFVVSHPDLPGCASFGDTVVDALNSLDEVRRLWLEGQVEANGVAPEPRVPENYSGKFVVRLPKWLHRMLENESSRQACSLNTLVVSLLSLGACSSPAVAQDYQASPDPEHLRFEWDSEWESQTQAKWSFSQFLAVHGKRHRVPDLLSQVSRRRIGRSFGHKDNEYGTYDEIDEAEITKPN